MNISVCNTHGELLQKPHAREILENTRIFKYVIDQINVVDSRTPMENHDYIYPTLGQWRGVCPEYNELKGTKLYDQYSEKMVIHSLEDIPTCLHDGTTSKKFLGMPVHDWETNIKSNAIMIPLIGDSRMTCQDSDHILKCRNTKRTLEYVFIGNRFKKHRRESIFLNFEHRDDSRLINTYKKFPAIFNIRRPHIQQDMIFKFLTNIADAKFGFCPAGRGLSSYRIGECMQVGVVPIIIGHKCLPLEPYIDWKEFALIFPDQNEVTHENIQKQLNGRDYKTMGNKCIEMWEQYFEPKSLYMFIYNEFIG